MASSLPPSLRSTLSYFAKYDYPLTAEELYFWQHGTRLPKAKVKRFAKASLSPLRKKRLKYSLKKWAIAQKIGESLKKFPTISAVFVTGALAMHNCPPDDDIDIMIITSPNTLWITRFFVVIYLKFLGIRRHPSTMNHELITNNQICDNLWLDTNHLQITPHDIYRAHEILQVKVLWDRFGVHSQFLIQNSWVKKYLPIAYRESLKIENLDLIVNCKLKIENLVLWPLNALFFAAQYVYMLPKMTSEKVGLGFAFFHPSKTSPS